MLGAGALLASPVMCSGCYGPRYRCHPAAPVCGAAWVALLTRCFPLQGYQTVWYVQPFYLASQVRMGLFATPMSDAGDQVDRRKLDALWLLPPFTA